MILGVVSYGLAAAIVLGDLWLEYRSLRWFWRKIILPRCRGFVAACVRDEVQSALNARSFAPAEQPPKHRNYPFTEQLA